MALTTVVSHATGDVFPATDWNTYVRDNINFKIVAGATLASAATIVQTNEFHQVSGTTTIDTITPAATAVVGQRMRMLFTGGPITVRHNGGGTGNVRLLTSRHATFVTNEYLELIWDGTNWQEASRSPRHLSGESVDHNSTTNLGSGYVAEDGSAISATVYVALSADLGTTYGTSAGNVVLPDSRGRMNVAYASGGHADVATVGLTDGLALASRRAKHKHTMNESAHTHSLSNTPSPSNTAAGGTQVASGSFNPGAAPTVNSATTGITVGPQTGSEPVDSPAYIVRPRYTRI